MEIENSNQIAGIYIFGSHARGDNHQNSDLDIISISHNTDISTNPLMNMSTNADISYYELKKIKEYYRLGHLFAWHLFLESKYIEGHDYLSSLGRPDDYSLFKQDTSSLERLLLSIRDSLFKKMDKSLIIFEAGLLYIILRNLSHSLSWFELERPSFNRLTPYLLEDQKKLLISMDDYNILLQARHACTRGGEAPDVNLEWLHVTYYAVEKWFYYKMGSHK